MQPLSFPLHLSFRAYLKHIPNTVFKINKKVSYFYIFSLRINVARFARYARNFGEWDFLKWFSNIVPHLETNERIFNLVFSHHYTTNTQIQVMWTTKSVFRTKCLQRKDRTLLPISFTLKSGSTWKAAPYNLSLLSHYAHFWGSFVGFINSFPNTCLRRGRGPWSPGHALLLDQFPRQIISFHTLNWPKKRAVKSHGNQSGK